MSDALKAYLAKGESEELDADVLKEHLRAMTEEVIPAIVDDLRKADEVAAELRFSPATTHRRDS
jgi:hypothetical protein